MIHLFNRIQKQEYGPLALAIMGGALIGLGLNGVGELRSSLNEAPLQASLFTPLEEVPEVTSGPAPSVTPTRYVSSLSVAEENIVEAEVEVPLTEELTGEAGILQEKLHEVRAAYEAEYNAVKAAEMKLEAIESAVIQFKLEGGDEAKLQELVGAMSELETQLIPEENEDISGVVPFLDSIPRG